MDAEVGAVMELNLSCPVSDTQQKFRSVRNGCIVQNRAQKPNSGSMPTSVWGPKAQVEAAPSDVRYSLQEQTSSRRLLGMPTLIGYRAGNLRPCFPFFPFSR